MPADSPRLHAEVRTSALSEPTTFTSSEQASVRTWSCFYTIRIGANRTLAVPISLIGTVPIL
ncbi:hypothetical protein DVB88_21130 [Tsukamurella pulmonis]|nr:hypothetical protein DVB88_21130 [Tsukamurella pulmonis]